MQEHSDLHKETPDDWPKDMPFRLPPDYFAKQRANILQTIQYDWELNISDAPGPEIERISPLLSDMKRRGVKGRWNDDTSTIQSFDKEINIIEDNASKNKKIKKINHISLWSAAAALAGLLLLGKLMMDSPITLRNMTETSSTVTNLPDSVGFSDADINAYLAETSEIPAALDASASMKTVEEQFLASADLLAAPEKLIQQMDAIPIDELEAYITDIPTLNE
jgi:hypothetical protein